MDIAPPEQFKHTTLKACPGAWVKDPDGNHGHRTPDRAGITLLDEEPGFTGIYIRDKEGGLWPARTVSHTPPEHHKSVCEAWLRSEGAIDLRTHR